jgi:dTDP-4-amino-4,6-dideoxygalactose transaminase
MHIPFVDLKAQYTSIKSDIDNAINSVVSETAFIGGKYVKEFEKSFAQAYGVKHCISCANGTDSLYIIMKMLGVGSGDEVITVANSWISSAETIGQTGATPVFVDIDQVYFSSMDMAGFEKAITPKTKAVIAVHLHGQALDIQLIADICNQHNIALIEDCAQSHFTQQNGINVGTFGIAGSFSFYPGKNLGAYGDAGCIVTNDDALAEKFRMYANHGALVKHQHQIEGINSRLDGLHAAILTAKLPYLLQWNQARRNVAQQYDTLLANVGDVQVARVRPNTTHTYHLFVILTKERDALKKHLELHGVDTAIHYPTIMPLMPAYAHLNYTASQFPNAVAYQNSCLSLPIFPEMESSQIEYVANTIKQFFIK